MGLGVATLCGGGIFVAGPRVWEAWERSGWREYYLGGDAGPGTPPVRSGLDWMTARLLSQIYSTALDRVVADAAVQERLGEPIEQRTSECGGRVRLRQGHVGEALHRHALAQLQDRVLRDSECLQLVGELLE